MSRNSQATHSIFGWIFQVSVGIWLFFDRIKDIAKIKIEGKTEDVELELDNGKMVYVQAKSISNINEFDSNDLNKLNKALKGLAKIKDKNAELIYATNIPNPVHTKTRNYFDYSRNYYFYDDIPSRERTKFIDIILTSASERERFKILLINFFGEGREKYSKIREKIEFFLIENDLQSSYSQKIMRKYIVELIDNATNKYIILKKSEIIYNIAYVVIDKDITPSDYALFTKDNDLELLNEKYREFIDRKVNDFQFTTKIVGDFGKCKSKYSNSAEYILEEWKKYDDIFSSEKDEEQREKLIKNTLFQILKRKNELVKIKNGANL